MGGGEERASSTLCGRRDGRKKERVGTEGREDNAMQQGRIDFNTVNPSLPTGMDFLIHPCRWIDDEENVRTPPKLGR